MTKFLSAVFLALFWVTAAAAQTEHMQHMQSDVKEHTAEFRSHHLDVEQWFKRLEDPKRDVIAHRDGVVAALGLKPGMYVADVGAGTGAYMQAIAAAVGDKGRYFGVDISSDFVGYMRDRAVKNGLENATLVVSRTDDATLPPQSVDMVLVVDTYHHFDPVAPMLGSILSALKPGGTLVIVDFDRIEGKSRQWILDQMRADKGTFRGEIEAAGFRFVEEVKDTGLEENFFFRFRKP